ncbi:MAG TPA: PsbP-related protein, partial [Actinomycetota bacterium]|nr:PsbP-related protein [Actinomycetota bacterium]
NEQKKEGAAGQDDTAGGGAEGETDPGEVPEGWVAYTDDASGYSIAYPEGWEPISQGPNTVDFTDPDSGGTYMRVEWTDTPGDDVVGTLEDIAASFSSSHDDYEELALEATDYQDFDAGIWEYLYSDGIDLHATNLQFVTDDHGFALNFQTPAEEWDEAQEIRETFESTFRSP